jgi:hypothetical protein
MAKKRRYHTCRKRRGSPRFSTACKQKFRECLRGELKETGSMRSAGRACMTVLHQCQAGRGHTRSLRRKGRR